MTFPQTRYSLVQRLASVWEDRDWKAFLEGYWEPVCRFAARRGRLGPEDAEDVAAQTFEVLLDCRLLARWLERPKARLHTLLCGVVSNMLANRARVQQGRARILREHPGIFRSEEVPAEDCDCFYADWVDGLLTRAIEHLMRIYHEEGRGDHFRILHGRICEGMTLPEIARSLGLGVGQAEGAYRHARTRLATRLEALVRDHVKCYASPEAAPIEFAAEWAQLGDYLKRSGGLEGAVRRGAAFAPPGLTKREDTSPRGI